LTTWLVAVRYSDSNYNRRKVLTRQVVIYTMENNTQTGSSIADSITQSATASGSRRRTSGLMSQEESLIKNDFEQDISEIESYLTQMGETIRETRSPMSSSDQAPEDSLRPEARYATEFEGTYSPSGPLKSDPEFVASVEKLAEKRGISTSEIYKIIQGESGFKPTAQNKSGATGLFQLMPASAKELGYSTSDIKKMSPSQQVDLYDKYLDRWSYSNKNRLGIMQAAPAFANREPEAIIYGKSTAAWKQNPGWREKGDGPITVRSINSYYARQK